MNRRARRSNDERSELARTSKTVKDDPYFAKVIEGVEDRITKQLYDGDLNPEEWRARREMLLEIAAEVHRLYSEKPQMIEVA